MPINGYLGGVISATAPTVNNSGASGVFTLDEQLQYAGQNLWPGYQISRSVRLRSSASAYFNRTLTTPTGTTKWTWSGWVKRGSLGSAQTIFSGSSDVNNWGYFGFLSGDTLTFSQADAGSVTSTVTTTQVFRDSSAWYHIVVVFDTTQATSANRLQMYINGSLITAFGTASYLAQNTASRINTANAHQIYRYFSAANYVDGYLAETYFIDGQALTPTSFGAFDAVTGIWNPIKYSGTYGTNGFYLNFSDNSSNTATTIGKDYSGNGNNWTPNNISVTAGTTYDSMVDVPIGYGSDTGAGGEVRGNYCVLNPLSNDSTNTLSAANLNYSIAANQNGYPTSTFQFSSGKWYWECTVTSTHNIVGIVLGTTGTTTQLFSTGYGYYYTGNKYVNGVSSAYGASFTTNDVIGVAVDLDSGTPTITFYKNGTSQGAITIAAGTYKVAGGNGNSAATATGVYNFGQTAFSYTAPSGFKALCTQNLPTPTILNGANYMAASLYTGTGTAQTITNTVNGISFQPDFVWGKIRSGADYHVLIDAVRGNTVFLKSNTTDGDTTQTQNITSFNSNGYSIGTSTDLNRSTYTFVGWQWKANGAGSSNTAGSITSTVSVNTTAGFSVATYTGNSTSGATVGHGLGVAPSMVIVKARGTPNGIARSWFVYHISLGGTKYIYLDLTNAAVTGSTVWNDTNPSSTVFTLGNENSVNMSSNNYVAYCFAAISGYSAFGSYTGNGSTDGPFVYTGFRPRWIMYKSTSSSQWGIFDTSRNQYNSANLLIKANASDAEGDNTATYDFLSNGFKLRIATYEPNKSGETYIYAAFAENPFTLSRAR